jgi:CheY-like chemotaxis protein
MCFFKRRRSVLSSVIHNDTFTKEGSAGVIDSDGSAALPVPLPVLIQSNKHLIVDDSSWNRLVLKRCLVDLGYTVEEADDGRHALTQVSVHGEFAIIWMDIRMGSNQMSGIEATRLLRQHYSYKGAIIGLTGYVDDKSYQDAKMCGMTHCLHKPFRIEVVKLHCEQYCKPLPVIRRYSVA